MNSSSFGVVVYGYKLDHQLFRVAEGIDRVCQSNSSHEIMKGGAFCPQCGSSIVERERMEPSPLVVKYAIQHGYTLNQALALLESYQCPLIQWYGKEREWILGLLVANVEAEGCSAFETFAHPSRIKDLEEAVQLFTDLGLDPTEAKYYLWVNPTNGVTLTG